MSQAERMMATLTARKGERVLGLLAAAGHLEELGDSHRALRQSRVIEGGPAGGAVDQLKHVDRRLQTLDEAGQPTDEPGRAAALARDRTFEVEVLGEDRPQPRSIEGRDPVSPAVVIGVDQLSCAVLRGSMPSFHLMVIPSVACSQVSGPGSIPRAAARSRGR